MATKFDDVITDFYAVESMFWSLKPQVLRMTFPECFGLKHRDGQRYPLNSIICEFVKELGEWREQNHKPMARMLRDSLLGMAIGESRHSTAWDRYSGLYELNHDLLTSNRGRQYVYDRLGTFSVRDASVLEELFDCSGWCDSFGGDSWADITRYVQKYNDLDATTFIDTVVHAVHNGGCAFDKGLLVMTNSSGAVQTILDQKFSGSVLDLHFLKPGEQVHLWILRYQKLMNSLGFPCKIPEEMNIHNGITYDQIEWATDGTLELDENPEREQEESENYCNCCDSYSCGCNDDSDGCDCDECNPEKHTNLYSQALAQANPNIINPIAKGNYNVKKVKKLEQEKAKKQGVDYDYHQAKVCDPMSLR